MQNLLESRAHSAAKGAATDTTADVLLRMTRESMSGSFSHQKFSPGKPHNTSAPLHFACPLFSILCCVLSADMNNLAEHNITRNSSILTGKEQEALSDWMAAHAVSKLTGYS